MCFLCRYLQEQAYAVLEHFVSEFEREKSKYPSLFPTAGMVEAQTRLSKFPLGSDAELDVSFLSAQGKQIWDECALYKAFCVKHIDATIAQAMKKVIDVDGARKALVEKLLLLRPDDASLLFAATFL